MLRFASVCAFVLGLSLTPVVSAQTDDDRARAADAYDRGARAFRSEDYGESARWFERANQLAPSPIALVQAVRAYLRAHDFLRAGTLALALEGDPGLSPRVQDTVREAITGASSRYVRVEVSCTATCTLAVDGEAQPSMRFYLEPDHESTIAATFSNGSRSDVVNSAAGTSRTIAFEAPEGAISTEAVAEAAEYDDLESVINPYTISKVAFMSRPRATAFTAMAATVVVGGITTWSALDARNSRQDRDAAVNDGTDAERIAELTWEHRRDVRRTRGYLGFTGMMVALTGMVAGFTDWTPERQPATTASVAGSRDGGMVTVHHRF